MFQMVVDPITNVYLVSGAYDKTKVSNVAPHYYCLITNALFSAAALSVKMRYSHESSVDKLFTTTSSPPVKDIRDIERQLTGKKNFLLILNVIKVGILLSYFYLKTTNHNATTISIH